MSYTVSLLMFLCSYPYFLWSTSSVVSSDLEVVHSLVSAMSLNACSSTFRLHHQSIKSISWKLPRYKYCIRVLLDQTKYPPSPATCFSPDIPLVHDPLWGAELKGVYRIRLRQAKKNVVCHYCSKNGLSF